MTHVPEAVNHIKFSFLLKKITRVKNWGTIDALDVIVSKGSPKEQQTLTLRNSDMIEI